MDNISITNLRNNLKGYRVKNGYSQEDLAEVLNVHVSTIKNWEKQPNKMTFEKLAKLATLYKCDVKDFFL